MIGWMDGWIAYGIGLGIDQPTMRQEHERHILDSQLDAESLLDAAQNRGAIDVGVARVHDDPPSERRLRQCGTDGAPQHSLSAAAIVAVWMEECECRLSRSSQSSDDREYEQRDDCRAEIPVDHRLEQHGCCD